VNAHVIQAWAFLIVAKVFGDTRETDKASIMPYYFKKVGTEYNKNNI
jgi:hypothetical protein